MVKGQSVRIVILFQILLFFVVSLSGKGLADLIMKKKGMIAGASHVNLRSGPGISHPALKILRSGEKVDVESLEGSWYRVGLSDGKRGYVYEGLLYLLGKEEIEVAKIDSVAKRVREVVDKQPFTEQRRAPKKVDLTESNGGREKDSSKVPWHQPEILNVQLVEKELPEAKTLLPIEMDRKRLMEIVAWLGAALCIFIFGWVLGGNYYLRRDRNDRNKLHF